jgi:hypothetical protein
MVGEFRIVPLGGGVSMKWGPSVLVQEATDIRSATARKREIVFIGATQRTQKHSLTRPRVSLQALSPRQRRYKRKCARTFSDRSPAIRPRLSAQRKGARQEQIENFVQSIPDGFRLPLKDFSDWPWSCAWDEDDRVFDTSILGNYQLNHIRGGVGIHSFAAFMVFIFLCRA